MALKRGVTAQKHKLVELGLFLAVLFTAAYVFLCLLQVSSLKVHIFVLMHTPASPSVQAESVCVLCSQRWYVHVYSPSLCQSLPVCATGTAAD